MANLFADLLLDDSDEIIVESDTIVFPKLIVNSASGAGAMPEGSGTSDYTKSEKIAENCLTNETEKKVTISSKNDRKAESVNDENKNDRKAESVNVENKEAEGEKKCENGEETVALSKRAKRRAMLRQQMLLRRLEKRKIEKERRKARRLNASPKTKEARSRKLVFCNMIDSKCKIRVAVDMAWEHLMNEELIRKTLTQLNFCYAANRRAVNPLQFYIVNLRGKTDAMYRSREGILNWDVYYLQERIEELWSPKDIVYLTADSHNTLEKLDEQKTYVIGGLIDHNSHKGVCLENAISKGFSHARLPIEDFVKMKTRKVLTINHVFEILLHFSVSKNWEQAFFSAIPTRKGVERLTATSATLEDKKMRDKEKVRDEHEDVIVLENEKRRLVVVDDDESDPNEEVDEGMPSAKRVKPTEDNK